MATRTIKVRECVCEQCGWAWLPRSDSLPSICPRCKRTSWNEPKRGSRG